MSDSHSALLRGFFLRTSPKAWLIAALAALALPLATIAATPATASMTLQCVTYARAVSGINLHGDAGGWWDQAAGLYDRGTAPRIGAVMNFKPTSAMPRGHVAVVSTIIDDRHVLLDHANWSGHGMVEHGVLAEDVSPARDWSRVRVWYAPSHSLGLRESPVYGFIYSAPADAARIIPEFAANDTGAEAE